MENIAQFIIKFINPKSAFYITISIAICCYLNIIAIPMNLSISKKDDWLPLVLIALFIGLFLYQAALYLKSFSFNTMAFGSKTNKLMTLKKNNATHIKLLKEFFPLSTKEVFITYIQGTMRYNNHPDLFVGTYFDKNNLTQNDVDNAIILKTLIMQDFLTESFVSQKHEFFTCYNTYKLSIPFSTRLMLKIMT